MKKPSQLIRAHIDGTGNGYELDDLVSRWKGQIHDEIGDRLVAIHRRFRTENYPIGTSNPESFDQLEQLAKELEERGY